MIIYLTYNEQPSGIFSSQVVDVVRFLNEELNTEVKLVSLISIRQFFKNRSLIKSQCPQAIILPMFPGISKWKWNKVTLNFVRIILSPGSVIARSVLATNLALDSNFKKVIYDGRGAISAEWEEYKVVNDNTLINEIKALEKKAINSSGFRIAVSHQLIKYWESTFNYSSKDHVVIPCTLNKDFTSVSINELEIDKRRRSLGFDLTDIVFVYSGSIAGWQSMELLNSFLSRQLGSSNKKKVLFLSETNRTIEELKKSFPEQVVQKKVKVNEVHELLSTADYGLLIRERSVTNKVASPVKFAEYLACGLKVIISYELGDYTDMILSKNWGQVLNSMDLEIVKPTQIEKMEISSNSKALFSKHKYMNEYKHLLYNC